jgi:hypothetical protein
MENIFHDFEDENYWLTNTCILLYNKTVMDLLLPVEYVVLLTRKSDIDRGELYNIICIPQKEVICIITEHMYTGKSRRMLKIMPEGRERILNSTEN